jgi:tRNA uridine 5-carboxymethylaminomethyl modification enzyme
MDYGFRYGLIDEKTFRTMENNRRLTEIFCKKLEETYIPGVEEKTSLADYLRRPDVSMTEILPLCSEIKDLPEHVKEEIEIEIKYSGYIKRELDLIQKTKKDDIIIPETLDFTKIQGISTEAKEKLIKYRPFTIRQAKMIDGISPSDISAIYIYLKKIRK